MNDITNDNSYSSDDNMDNESGFSSSLLTVAAVLTFIIMVVGLFGNFLTVVALLKCPKVRNVAAAFIISLCLADLLFCALVLPFMGIRFLQGTWTHGEVLCRLIPFIQYGNIGVSLLCIAMITINRYVMIAHHSSYGKIYKKHWIAAMIAFCWLFAYGMQLPTLFGVWGKFGYDARLGTCSIMTDDHGRSSKTTLFIIAFVIPCLIIIACYAKIFWVVHKSEARLKQHANKQNSIPNNLRPTPASSTENAQQRISSNAASDSSFSTDAKLDTVVQKPTRVKDQREVRAKRNEWRITKMVLAIFLSFVVCYLPITIAKVADKDVEHPVFHILSYILLYLSACINPIIYVIMNKQYRKAYKTVILCEPSKLLPFNMTPKGNSVGEKWKDAGFSNNHSRTMVSQMSAGEQQNTSLSSSQPTPIALEMTSTTPTKNQVSESAVREKPTPAGTNSSIEQHSNGRTAAPIVSHLSIKLQPSISSMARPTKETNPNRIALVGGDIILEEEEEAATVDPGEVPATTKERTYVNVPPPRKTPFYGQNINDIPDNGPAKLTAKLKI